MEPCALLLEEQGLGGVSGVDAGEDDVLARVEPEVEEAGCHHESKLGVIVDLGAGEAVSVGHGNRVVKTLLKPLQLIAVGNGVGAPTTNSDAVPRDRPNHDEARVGVLLHAKLPTLAVCSRPRSTWSRAGTNG